MTLITLDTEVIKNLPSHALKLYCIMLTHSENCLLSIKIPELSKLARYMNRQTIFKNLRLLEDHGLIIREKKGFGECNTYRILLDFNTNHNKGLIS